MAKRKLNVENLVFQNNRGLPRHLVPLSMITAIVEALPNPDQWFVNLDESRGGLSDGPFHVRDLPRLKRGQADTVSWLQDGGEWTAITGFALNYANETILLYADLTRNLGKAETNPHGSTAFYLRQRESRRRRKNT